MIVVLQNNLGGFVTIDQVKTSANNQECSSNQSISLNNNGKVIYTITQCNNGLSGRKFDGKINITYTPENKLTHNIAGTLRAKVVEGLPFSSQNVCQSAEDDGLCGGLDIVYGIGYKAVCCSEHNLCCS